MNEAVKSIQEKLLNDPKLREQFGEEMERLAASDQAATPDEALIKAAKSILGMDISASDLEKARAASEELDPQEFANVSGGECGRFCTKDYWCYIAYHHDSDDKDTACWWNYVCLAVYKCMRAAN